MNFTHSASLKSSEPLFDAGLIQRHDLAGPRYTSYPTAAQFHSGFREPQYREAVRRANKSQDGSPLSLYFHIPFCSTVCFYCACNKIITNNRKHAGRYLEYLHREIAAQARIFDQGRPVNQLHWGGGTPTYLDPQQMTELMAATRRYFNLKDGDEREYSIEIDPRSVIPDTIKVLADLGFNRLSLGVQDFDSNVQRAVNRVQPERQTLDVIDSARESGFTSINLDLIYGLPMQTVESFTATLESIINTQADRLSIFNYAHLPGMFKTQRQIDESTLPSSSEKLDILQLTTEKLIQAGYVYIGMDHFALPDDELALAQRNRKLHRNFQGYSTHADSDLLALGISGISRIGDSYSQNVKGLEEYYDRLDNDLLPIFRGISLTTEDRIRREIIGELICHFAVDYAAIEARYGIEFQHHFADELSTLHTFVADELVNLEPAGIRVQPKGRMLIRNICMVFDEYLGKKPATTSYSRVI